MSTADQHRLALNNILQKRYGTNVVSHLRWEIAQAGVNHSPTWNATVYVDGHKRGQGSGGDKGTAKENAAEIAVRELQRQWAHLL